jgi:hypothetical protein
VRRVLLAALLLVPAVLQGQSSQFGVNGLGIPGREMSARALATGGSFALYDPASAINPAALAEYGRFNATFTILQNYRSSQGPQQQASGRDTRFPLMAVGGLVPKTRLALGLSFATYADRDYTLSVPDTVDFRGAPLPINDSLVSNGGLSDLRLGAAYRLAGWEIGAGMQIITGSARLSLTRSFGDTLYRPVNQKAEISYAGVGAAIGLARPLGRRLALAAFLRLDGHANVERDSTDVGTVDLPVSFGGALRWRPSARLDLAGSVMTSRWGTADDDIRTLGGAGSRNTVDIGLGGELLRDPRAPERKPIRFGAHFRTLPFPVTTGAQPKEYGLSVGTGFIVARDRSSSVPTGLLNFTLDKVWRSAEGGYSESAWLFAAGVTLRP